MFNPISESSILHSTVSSIQLWNRKTTVIMIFISPMNIKHSICPLCILHRPILSNKMIFQASGKKASNTLKSVISNDSQFNLGKMSSSYSTFYGSHSRILTKLRVHVIPAITFVLQQTIVWVNTKPGGWLLLEEVRNGGCSREIDWSILNSIASKFLATLIPKSVLKLNYFNTFRRIFF